MNFTKNAASSEFTMVKTSPAMFVWDSTLYSIAAKKAPASPSPTEKKSESVNPWDWFPLSFTNTTSTNCKALPESVTSATAQQAQAPLQMPNRFSSAANGDSSQLRTTAT